jgi:hypothetical protein
MRQSLLAAWILLQCELYAVWRYRPWISACQPMDDYQNGGKLFACHRQVLAIEVWQGKWGTWISNWLSYVAFASDWSGWWTSAIWQAPQKKTTPRENRIVARWATRTRFATSARIRDELNFDAMFLCYRTRTRQSTGRNKNPTDDVMPVTAVLWVALRSNRSVAGQMRYMNQ